MSRDCAFTSTCIRDHTGPSVRWTPAICGGLKNACRVSCFLGFGRAEAAGGSSRSWTGVRPSVDRGGPSPCVSVLCWGHCWSMRCEVSDSLHVGCWDVRCIRWRSRWRRRFLRSAKYFRVRMSCGVGCWSLPRWWQCRSASICMASGGVL